MVAGMRNFLRNAWLSTAATAVMTVTLIIILVSFISSSALTATIKGIVNKVHVSLYLKDSAGSDQIQDLKKQLESQPNVQSVSFVSKSDALAIYRTENRNNKKLLDAISETDNPLPASLQILAKDPNKLDPIVNYVKQNQQYDQLVAEYSYAAERKTTIDRIVRVSNFLKTTGLVASLLFTVISILIIFNTIRMAIFTRRSEIEIMKLVGATNWFIRGPFLFEAALYGIIAAVVAVLMAYGLILGAAPKINSYIDVGSTIAFFRNNPVIIVLAELIIGIFIGMLSSMLAMMRYLKL
ncbi:MAG TPA: permease-like cell division protein FtsX [Candidatus Nanoarchaeia archaeon]|nr:permease-like cell division protein FtsX [Candidatus Nanoarchaeia archaeon]